MKSEYCCDEAIVFASWDVFEQTVKKLYIFTLDLLRSTILKKMLRSTGNECTSIVRSSNVFNILFSIILCTFFKFIIYIYINFIYLHNIYFSIL